MFPSPKSIRIAAPGPVVLEVLTLVVLLSCQSPSSSTTTTPTQGGSWQTLGTTKISSDVTAYADAFDRQGNLYVFYGEADDGRASAVKFDGTSWAPVGSAKFSEGAVWGCSLAVAPSGTPYVAFIDAGSDTVRVMKFDGASWVDVGSGGAWAQSTNTFSLTMAPSGTPYLAYADSLDDSSKTETSVVRFDGTAWVQVGSRGFSPVFYDMTIAVDASGTPYVASYEQGEGYHLHKFNGTDWVPVVSDMVSSTQPAVIAFDGSGTIYFAHRDKRVDPTEPLPLRVAKIVGSSLVPVYSTADTNPQIYSFGLAVNSRGTPYVAYTDVTNGYKTVVERFDGTGWVPVGAQGFLTGETYVGNVAFNGSNTPFAVVYEGENVTVMKFE